MRLIYKILFALSILVNIALLIPFTGYTLMFSVGHSMCPNHGPISLVLNKESHLEEIEVGKVYVYNYYNKEGKQKLVQHRLIAIQEDSYIFKGDNNTMAEVVPIDAVLYIELFNLDLVKCE